MKMSYNQRSVHATASPRGDELTSVPMAWVLQPKTGFLNIIRKQTKNYLLVVGMYGRYLMLEVKLSQCIPCTSTVSIACLSEIRLPGSDPRCIKVPGADTCYWQYHTGPQDNSGKHGVRLAPSYNSHDALLSRTPI